MTRPRRQGPRRAPSAAVLLTTLLLGACATSGGSVERTLAQAGVRTTQALAADVESFGRRLDDGDTTAAFVATWQACAATGASCAITEPSGAVQAQRAELAASVALRAQAIAALGRAYAAFHEDVTRQPGDQMERAVQDAVTGTVAYAGSVTRLPLGGGAGIAQPLRRAAGAMASAATAHQRRARALEASADLALALANLREALLLETRKYDALAEALVRERIDAHRALLQAGLVSGADTLRPVADRLRIPLARDADAVIARSAPTRRAVEAMIEASERSEVRRTQQRYRAAVAALGELEQVHGQLNAGRAEDLTTLDQALWNLDRLSERTVPPRPPPTSAPAVQSVVPPAQPAS